MSASSAASSVVAASSTASAHPQVTGLPENCYGQTNVSISEYSWNGTSGAGNSVCGSNFNDITIYCCQQAGGNSTWGAKNGSAVAEGQCGLQLCKLASDKEADFIYCNTQYGANGQCKAGTNASASNSTSGSGAEASKKSAAVRVGPASIAMGLVFLASLGLSL